jgi:hypothetical protein
MTIFRGSQQQLLLWGLHKASQAPSELWSAAGQFFSPSIFRGVCFPARGGSIRWLQTAAAEQPPEGLPTVNYRQAQRIRQILKARYKLRHKNSRCVRLCQPMTRRNIQPVKQHFFACDLAASAACSVCSASIVMASERG